MRAAGAATLLLLGACTTDLSPDVARQPIGDFRLQHLVVVAEGVYAPPVSRRLPDAALEAALEDAVGARLRRFDGEGRYSVGIKVAGYVLAPRAVPVLFAPRSQLYLNVIAYDANQQRLNVDPHQLVVNERAGGDTIIGSGYSQSAEDQLAELAQNAAIEIEKWLRDNPDWFARPPSDSAAGAEAPRA